MGLKEVEADILKRIRNSARSVEREGKREADSTLKRAEDKVNNLKRERDAEVKRLVSNICKKEEAQANLKAKKIRLQVKKEIMDLVHKRVEGRISKLSASEKRVLLKALIERAKKEVAAKYVYSNEADKTLVKSLARGLVYGGTIDCVGGVVVENASKDVGVDYTFETLLDQVRENFLKGVADRLF